ncbi:MAG: NRDE family protein [Bacteroidales bacterium]|nr:NRDE family protein [Bacteroidales bacterium]
MCLIFFSINEHPKYKLIVAANRDEFYQRPTQQAHWWEHPEILAGKDLQANGTWMALNKNGEFAALTNYRDPAEFNIQNKSRGNIVVEYFKTEDKARFFNNLINSREQYNGYNFIGFNNNKITYYSNQLSDTTVLEKGSFALSNHLLDSPWPKVEKIKREMKSIINQEEFTTESVFGILLDNTVAQDNQLPLTGVPIETERMLSSVFIQSEKYGTRSSYVLLMDYSNKIRFEEKTWHPKTTEVRFLI